MVEAGIEDPDSLEGKIFCTGKCPYDRCIVFEECISPYTAMKNRRTADAKEMRSKGNSIEEIAEKLGVSYRTVQRYLYT